MEAHFCLELFSPERKNRSIISCADVIRSLFLMQFESISGIVRQSFIVALSAAQKRFSVRYSLMTPAVARPIVLELRERRDRPREKVGKFELFYFSPTALTESRKAR